MKARLVTLFLFFIYLSAVLVQGISHRHEDLAGALTHKPCAACLWQLDSLSDPPIDSLPLLTCEAKFASVFYNSPSPASFFSVSCASRAPPCSSSSSTVAG